MSSTQELTPLMALTQWLLTKEDLLEDFMAAQRIQGFTAEQRLEGLTVEERLEGLTVEERLEGLSRVERVVAVVHLLPLEALRALPAKLVSRMPEEARAELRARLRG